ncbi:MAG: hypothetical protein AAF772_09010 [Acidobacteriota bacterium]
MSSSAPRDAAAKRDDAAAAREPLSFAQLRLWHGAAVRDRSAASALAVRAIDLRGPLRVAALDAALGDVFARHTAFGTAFRRAPAQADIDTHRAEPMAHFRPPSRRGWRRIDLSRLPAPRRAEAALRAGCAASQRAMHRGRPPLVRALLLVFAPDHHRRRL